MLRRGYRSASARRANDTRAGGAAAGAARRTLAPRSARGNALGRRARPAWPACRWLSSMTSSIVGAKRACEPMRMRSRRVAGDESASPLVLPTSPASPSRSLAASQKPCGSAKSSVSPIAPTSLKLTQMSCGKLHATYRLSAPTSAKNTIHARLMRPQRCALTGARCSPSVLSRKRCTSGWSPTNWLDRKAPLASQFTIVTFHWMKRFVVQQQRGRPNTSTSAAVTQWSGFTVRVRNHCTALCTTLATMSTAVADEDVAAA